MEACTIDINEKRKGFAPSSFVLKKKASLDFPEVRPFPVGKGNLSSEKKLCAVWRVFLEANHT